jgi:FixJ family two-component response regulator
VNLADAEPRSIDGATLAVSGAPGRATERPIFIVDDDAFVRDSLSVLLETFGFEVCLYDSGDQFLADERRPAAGCLIIDQHMPGIDGLTTLAALRRDGDNVPSILITGRLDADIAARAAELGVVTVLEKPFQASRLVELARAATGMRS